LFVPNITNNIIVCILVDLWCSLQWISIKENGLLYIIQLQKLYKFITQTVHKCISKWGGGCGGGGCDIYTIFNNILGISCFEFPFNNAGKYIIYAKRYILINILSSIK
jgi:hypothetical protein